MKTNFRRFKIHAFLLLLIFLISCENDNGTTPENGTAIFSPNRAPSTWLSVQEINVSESDMRIHFNWGGSDADGEVIYYQWSFEQPDNGLVPNDVWYNIHSSDTVLIFLLNEYPPPFDTYFHVRAIDDKFKTDDTSASCLINYEF